MYNAAIVADDLTGAMDTAHGFAARGHRTAVLALPGDVEGSLESDASVVGINTDSRYVDRETAVEAVKEAVRRVPAEVVFKKIDSTLRGNVAAEIDAALTEAGSDLAVVAPAFPGGGRTTEDGVHLVDGTPVADTEYGADEGGPTDSSIPVLLSGLDRRVVTVKLAVVEEGVDAVRSALREAVEGANESSETGPGDADRAHGAVDPAPIVVADARTDGDLATIAEAAADLDTLYVGSNGLADHVRVPESDPPSDTVDTEPTDEDAANARASKDAGAPLGVVGSINSATLTQLSKIPSDAVFELDPVATVTGEGNDGTVSGALARLRAGESAVVTAAVDRDAVDRTVAAGAERGLDGSEVRRRVAAELGETARRITAEEPPSGVFLTGGDIAVAVLRALDATTIRLTGRAVEAGIPIGRLSDGVAAGMPVVTKAGGFGGEATIVNCLNALDSSDE
jgi:uncharacterized protein YgbK (DUF1537 family)